MFSQVLFMPCLSFIFSKPANLFEISIWCCLLTSNSCSFLILNLSTWNFFGTCLLTANLSLTFATPRQWSVSQSATLKDRTSSILECHLLSINMWSIWLWDFPSGDVQVYLWMLRYGNIVLLTTRFFDVAKFAILTPLTLQSCRKLSLPFVFLKIFSLPSFALKSPNRDFLWYLRKCLKTC
jgi:hypothetical protein